MNDKTLDQQFIEYVVGSLVSNPDAVIVERKIDEKGVLLTLTVDPEDLGRVIGKRGATAQSLRTLLRALGTKQEARFNLKIVDNGIPREERMQNREENSEENNDQSRDNRQDSNNRQDTRQNEPAKQSTVPVEDAWNSGVDNDDSSSSAAQDAANDSGEEESAVERTRRELMDLDDLEV